MNTKHQQYLTAMGVEIWQSKGKRNDRSVAEAMTTIADDVVSSRTRSLVGSDAAASANDESSPPPPLLSTQPPTSQSSQPPSDWETLEKNVALCKQCALHKSRTQTVFGVGNRHAEVMLVGEAPGANEDLQGQPFVGRAGMLLNAMLHAIGMEREEVYIANILKCRPPNNRDPQPSEVALCTPFLQQQIALIQPKVIVAVGRIAAQFLLNTSEAMARLRGRKYSYGTLKTPLFVIYHPAYLLRSPREKSKAYVDMLQIQQHLHTTRCTSPGSRKL